MMRAEMFARNLAVLSIAHLLRSCQNTDIKYAYKLES